jgi:predicted  nucleic acid-binding Zn-ribbon protein
VCKDDNSPDTMVDFHLAQLATEIIILKERNATLETYIERLENRVGRIEKYIRDTKRTSPKRGS